MNDNEIPVIDNNLDEEVLSLVPDWNLTEQDKKETQIPKTPKTPKTPKQKAKKSKITVKETPKQNLAFDFEITEEIAEGIVMTVLESIHILLPKKFTAPQEHHIKTLSYPSQQVMKRWVSQFDMMKYLPEIALAGAFMAVLKDMKVEVS